MALDFPSSPAVGDKYPVSPIVGVPTYTWDGTAWMTSGSPVGQYVAKAGDTMSGDLTITKGTPRLRINATDGAGTGIIGQVSGSSRWSVNFGNGGAETGGNAGSDFALNRFNDAGVVIDTPLYIPRSNGFVSVIADPVTAFGIATKQYVDAGDVAGLATAGMQVNGSMEISQELGTAGGVNLSSGYILDGYLLTIGGTMVVTPSQAASTLFPGLRYCLAVTVGTAQPSLGAADNINVIHKIEGLRCSRLAWGTANAQPITIGFWSAHTRTGVYSLSIRNNAGNRSYAVAYTQVASVVPQYNVITIPGDTVGTWPTDNTSSIVIDFCLASGTTYVAPSANTWLAGIYVAAPGQVNSVALTTDCFRITGVVVLPGIHTFTAAQSPLLMRSYDQELILCKRYWQSYSHNDGFPFNFTGSVGGAGATPTLTVGRDVEMRAAPTGAFSGAAFTVGNCGQPVMFLSDKKSWTTYVSVTAAATLFSCSSVAGTKITFDARL